VPAQKAKFHLPLPGRYRPPTSGYQEPGEGKLKGKALFPRPDPAGEKIRPGPGTISNNAAAGDLGKVATGRLIQVEDGPGVGGEGGKELCLAGQVMGKGAVVVEVFPAQIGKDGDGIGDAGDPFLAEAVGGDLHYGMAHLLFFHSGQEAVQG